MADLLFEILLKYRSDIIAICSLIISALAIYISWRLTKEQSKLTLTQCTLSYVGMEDNDKELREAIDWVRGIKDIEIFAFSEDDFIYYKKNIDNSPLEKDELSFEYEKGRSFIHKVIAVRLVAAEAVIAGLLDESIYRIIRNRDFQKDYIKLKPFMDYIYVSHEYKISCENRALRMVVEKWKNSVIDKIKLGMKSTEWIDCYTKTSKDLDELKNSDILKIFMYIRYLDIMKNYSIYFKS
ncbi:hypothetical protein [uncultured Ottowia sp.]|uniref:hypothetical protein n=1 Tax=uncultured Ottowia sp. TaxID=543067 RepID=UPI0025963A87|nr:hypothetical protein [uncultured Ottowia sp.]